jgi:hypothetical protein
MSAWIVMPMPVAATAIAAITIAIAGRRSGRIVARCRAGSIDDSTRVLDGVLRAIPTLPSTFAL